MAVGYSRTPWHNAHCGLSPTRSEFSGGIYNLLGLSTYTDSLLIVFGEEFDGRKTSDAISWGGEQ